MRSSLPASPRGCTSRMNGSGRASQGVAAGAAGAQVGGSQAKAACPCPYTLWNPLEIGVAQGCVSRLIYSVDVCVFPESSPSPHPRPIGTADPAARCRSEPWALENAARTFGGR